MKLGFVSFLSDFVDSLNRQNQFALCGKPEIHGISAFLPVQGHAVPCPLQGHQAVSRQAEPLNLTCDSFFCLSLLTNDNHRIFPLSLFQVLYRSRQYLSNSVHFQLCCGDHRRASPGAAEDDDGDVHHAFDHDGQRQGRPRGR